MPAKHHRTVDRIVGILEHVARRPDGVTLAALADRLGAPKTSLQELTNGLLATGYLVEQKRRFFLGSGPFVLSNSASDVPLRAIEHNELLTVQRKLDRPVAVGVQMGFDFIFIDHAGDDVEFQFVTLVEPRREMLTTATGKTILANMSDPVLMDFLHRWVQEGGDQKHAEEFLVSRAEIRETGLVHNQLDPVSGKVAIATPLRAPDGGFLAAVCVLVVREDEPDLDEIGSRLIEAVAEWSFRSSSR